MSETINVSYDLWSLSMLLYDYLILNLPYNIYLLFNSNVYASHTIQLQVAFKPSGSSMPLQNMQ